MTSTRESEATRNGDSRRGMAASVDAPGTGELCTGCEDVKVLDYLLTSTVEPRC